MAQTVGLPEMMPKYSRGKIDEIIEILSKRYALRNTTAKFLEEEKKDILPAYLILSEFDLKIFVSLPNWNQIEEAAQSKWQKKKYEFAAQLEKNLRDQGIESNRLKEEILESCVQEVTLQLFSFSHSESRLSFFRNRGSFLKKFVKAHSKKS